MFCEYRRPLIAVLGFILAACAPQGLERPNGVAAANGSLYVLDSRHNRIVHLSSAGRLLGSFGKLGEGPNDIYFGWDLALGPDGNLYFCNQVGDDERTWHDGIKIFNPQGKLLREIGAADYTEFAERAYKPYGLDIDSAGRIYVADDGRGTVRVFTPAGEKLGEFLGYDAADESGPLGLTDVAVDDRRRFLYVVDYVRGQVEQFDLLMDDHPWQIRHRLSIGSYGHEAGELAFPQNIAVADDTGWIYVGDMANRRVQVFDYDGGWVNEFSPPGVDDWQAMGICLGADGTVYVADALNGVVWAFASSGEFLRRIGVQR